MARPALPLQDRHFGTLTAQVPESVRASNGAVVWQLACEHKRPWRARASDLHRGLVTGCGCAPSARSPTRLVTVDGVTLSLASWEASSGVPRATIRSRLDAGWEPALAVAPRTLLLTEEASR